MVSQKARASLLVRKKEEEEEEDEEDEEEEEGEDQNQVWNPLIWVFDMNSKVFQGD